MYVCSTCCPISKRYRLSYLQCRPLIMIYLSVQLFQGEEKVRASLYKLRVTWAPIFAASTLYKLDMKVNSEDSNWPIVNPRAQAGQGNTSAPSSTSGATASTSGQVHVNPKFLNNSTSNGVRFYWHPLGL